MPWWWTRFVDNLALAGRKYASDAIDELQRVLLRPEVDIQRMKRIVVFFLIVRIERREVPLVMSLHVADRKSYQTTVLIRVFEAGAVEI